jgi:ribokinase
MEGDPCTSFPVALNTGIPDVADLHLGSDRRHGVKEFQIEASRRRSQHVNRRASAGSIVVLGSLNMDLVVALPRLPRPAETVAGERLQTFPGGKGANQAVAAARLGGDVKMVGRVGFDTFGDTLIRALGSDGVDTSRVQRDADESTGAALILVERSGQNMIAVAPGANARVGTPEVERVEKCLDSDSVLVLQLEIPLPAVEAATQAARRVGARVILNAAPAAALPAELLRAVDVLVVNEIEASALFGRPVETHDEAAAAGRAALAAGVAAAVVTLGAAGAVLVDASGLSHVEAFPVTAVDTTAAGDAFVGALALALARGADLIDAVRLGAAAGAAAATHPGAQSSLPRVHEVLDLLSTDGEWAAGILNQRSSL